MPVFERADRAELEEAAAKLWATVKDDAEKVAKVVRGKEQSEPETSDVEVETK